MGEIVVLDDDFRQILPIINRGSRGDIVASIICSSIWSRCELHVLNENMRLRNNSQDDVASYFQWTLQLGKGHLHAQKIDECEEYLTSIKMPKTFLWNDNGNSIDVVLSSTYPSIDSHNSEREYFRTWEILDPKNEMVNEVNDHILHKFSDKSKTYRSADRISPS